MNLMRSLQSIFFGIVPNGVLCVSVSLSIGLITETGLMIFFVYCLLYRVQIFFNEYCLICVCFNSDLIKISVTYAQKF